MGGRVRRFEYILIGSGNPTLANSLFTYLVVEELFAALIGAIVIRALLDKVFSFAISYGDAFVALAAGSLVSTAFVWATGSAVQHSGNPGALPNDGILSSIAPMICSVGVTYWLLQRGIRNGATVKPRPGRRSDPAEASGYGDDTPVQRTSQTAWGFSMASYDELVSAARETSLGLVDTVSRATPEEVPDVISETLPTLQAITTKLENTTPPSAVPAQLHEALIGGMKQLQDDLVDTATSAVATAGQRIVRRGVFLPGSADVSDGGARYRWELSLSPGLKAIKEALTDLAALDIATNW